MKIQHLDLNIVKGNDLDFFKNPVFAHASNGKNGDPKSKIDDLYQDMENGLGKKVDIAGFKFCYVDIKDDTDVNEIFEYYKIENE